MACAYFAPNLYPICVQMKYNPQHHHRRSIRLPKYDYSQSGIYFVTICTHQKQYLFGESDRGKMFFNQIGKIVREEWLKSARIRQEIELDEYVIMPNHLHGIVLIHNNDWKIGDRGDECDRDTITIFLMIRTQSIWRRAHTMRPYGMYHGGGNRGRCRLLLLVSNLLLRNEFNFFVINPILVFGSVIITNRLSETNDI